MVTRTVKYSLAVLGVVVVVLLIAPFFINVESYKPEIAKAVEDATGRKLEIGKMTASLFPWVGVRLENLRLANRAGFSDRDFLKVESLELKVALLPLLSKEVEIKQFKLVAPELYIERNAEGAGNWEDLTSNEAATEGAPPAETPKETKKSKPAPLAALNAESMQLVHGRLIWAEAGSQVEFSEVTVEINDVQLDRPVEVIASTMLGEDRIALDAQVGPVGDLGKLNVAKLPIQATLSSDSLALKPLASMLPELPEVIGNAETLKLRLNAKLEQRPDGIRLSIGELAFVGAINVEGRWKAEMKGNKIVRLQEVGLGINGQSLFDAKGELSLGNKLRYQLRIEGQPISRGWLAGLFPKLKAMYASHPAPWQRLKLGALIAGDASRLEVRDMQLMLDRDLVQGSGVIAFDSAPDLRLRLNATELHMDPWLLEPQQNRRPATVASELKAAAKSSGSDEPDLRALRGWRVSSQVQIGTIHMRGLKLEHLRASLNGNRGTFRLDPLRFDFSGGQVTEKASLNLSVHPVQWSESVHMSDVAIGPVLKALADMDMIDGVLQMDTDLKATGLLPDNAKRSLKGKGSVLLRNGSVKGVDIAGTMRNLTSLGQMKGPKKTDFSQLQGSFTIRKGVAKNDDLFMASPLFRLTGNGTVNLPKGILDYHVKPRLVGTLIGQGDTVTVRKGLSVPLHVRGPFDGLRVSYEGDPATLIENIKALKGGGALKELKRAIGSKPAQSDQQTKKPEASTKPNPEKKTRKAPEGVQGH